MTMNSQSAIIQVFVYGTLKPRESNYQIYCQGKTIAEIPAYTTGQLYHLPVGYPAMTIGDQKIEGYLLSFRDSKILNSLDDLENYQETRASKLNDYYRQKVPIYSLPAGKSSKSDRFLGQAWCYFMSLEKITEWKGKLLTTNIWSSELV